MTLRLRIAGVTLAAVVGLFGATGTVGAAPQDDMKARHGEMKGHHKEMTAPHEDMTTRMAALDSRIDLLTQQMNSSAGEARVAAMAALLTAVVEQNQMMRSGMAEMKGGMTAKMESCPMHEKPDPSTGPSHDHNGMQK